MNECHICFEDILLDNNYTCSYGHIICYKCVYLVYDIDSDIIKDYLCPYCNNNTILLKIVPYSQIKKKKLHKRIKNFLKKIYKCIIDKIKNVFNLCNNTDCIEEDSYIIRSNFMSFRSIIPFEHDISYSNRNSTEYNTHNTNIIIV